MNYVMQQVLQSKTYIQIRRSKSVAFLLFGFSVVMFFFPTVSFADSSFTFDTYNNGDLNGQDTWSGGTVLDVVSSGCVGSTGKCIFSDSSGSTNVDYTFSQSLNAEDSVIQVSGYLKLEAPSSGNSGTVGITVRDTVNSTVCAISLYKNPTTNSFLFQINSSDSNDIATSTFSPTSLQWHYVAMQIDFDNGTCLGTSDLGVIGIVDLSDPTYSNVTKLRLNEGGSQTREKWIDNVIVTTLTQTATTTSLSCITCTRLILTDPDVGEVLPSNTDGYFYYLEYYINDDDYCSIWCETFIEVAIQHATGTEKYFYNLAVNQAGLNNLTHLFTQISDQGTYVAEIRLYNEWIFGSFRVDKIWEFRKFYVGAETPQAAIDAMASTSRQNNWNNVDIIEDGAEDIGSQESGGVIALGLRDIVSEFAHLPPWGYVVIFNEIIQNGTSTALGTLSISFATASPAFGKTVDLNLTSGFADAIGIIRSEGVTGEFGDSFDTFLHWWELLWYTVFAIWLISTILGFNLLSTVTSNKQQLDQQTRKKMTLDMRKKTHTINMKNN